MRRRSSRYSSDPKFRPARDLGWAAFGLPRPRFIASTISGMAVRMRFARENSASVISGMSSSGLVRCRERIPVMLNQTCHPRESAAAHFWPLPLRGALNAIGPQLLFCPGPRRDAPGPDEREGEDALLRCRLAVRPGGDDTTRTGGDLMQFQATVRFADHDTNTQKRDSTPFFSSPSGATNSSPSSHCLPLISERNLAGRAAWRTVSKQ